jgi:hypothetical protein
MDDRPEFELAIVESLEGQPRSDREEVAAAELTTSAEVIETLEALKATKGAPAVLQRFPHLERPELWGSTAYFSVSERSGTARALRVAGEPGGRVNVNGGLLFGVDEPPQSSRVDCIFDAPNEGIYTLNTRLTSWAGPLTAIVECFIDGTSFGELSVTGWLNQPHVARLGAGRHSFQIREVGGGPFLFLSLRVWMVPLVAPG